MKIEVHCSECGKKFEKDKKEVVRQNKKYRFKFYCCSHCSRVGAGKSRSVHVSEIKKCLNCGSDFESSTHVNSRKCCSKDCASSYSQSFQTEETRKIVSDKLKAHWDAGVFNGRLYERRIFNKKNCEQCSTGFDAKSSKRRFCSLDCFNAFRKKNFNLSSYRTACKFNFSLSDYPNEFDFSLIKEHGWYSPSNKKDNLNGVSRDHMVSVKFGYLNGVDSSIIAHPANCKLMKHSENFKKLDKCSISLTQLLDKISIWDKLYPN